MIGVFNDYEKKITIDKKNINLDKLFIYTIGTIFNMEYLCDKYKTKTEDLVYTLYKKYKLDFIQKLDGDFSIIIYDPSIKKIFLIKDKLAGVSLYYYYDNSNFIFSSSLREIMDNKYFTKTINKQALSNYLGYMYIYEPLTIFLNTYKVEKGQIIEFSDEIKKYKYYDLISKYKDTKQDLLKNEEQFSMELDKLIVDSVIKRGKKDSTVGVFMSSGEDSTLLAKLAKDYYKKVNTYTLGFENEMDESIEAKKIADFIGTCHHSIILKDKYVKDVIKKIPTYYDEPFADPSIIPSIYMIEHVKDKNDFFLSGDGNDALFVGSKLYDIYKCYPRIKLFIRKIINKFNKQRVYRDFSEMAQINIISRFKYSDKIINLRGQVYQLDSKIEKSRSASLGDLTNTVSEKYKVKTQTIIKKNKFICYTPLYELSILMKVFEIPSNILHHKKIFRKILYKHIPQKYFENYKKKGFGVPLSNWVYKFMLDDIIKISTLSFIEKQGLFDYYELHKLIASFKNDLNYSKAVVLWNYYIFQLWYLYNY